MKRKIKIPEYVNRHTITVGYSDGYEVVFTNCSDKRLMDLTCNSCGWIRDVKTIVIKNPAYNR